MRRFAIALLCLAAALASAQTPTPVTIHVDLGKSVSAYNPIGSWFGYDEINFTNGKYGSQLLPELHDLSAAPVYIRAHHLFTSGDGQPKLKWSSTNTSSPSTPAWQAWVYDFKVLDQIFDEYKAAGVRPMVELGFMPKDLASGTMDYEYPYPNTISGSVPEARPGTTPCGANSAAA